MIPSDSTPSEPTPTDPLADADAAIASPTAADPLRDAIITNPAAADSAVADPAASGLAVADPAAAGLLIAGVDPVDDSALDGHTLEELSDYLDRGRLPVDPSIEESPGCRVALAGMQRLRVVTHALLDRDAATERESDERWISGILDSISREAHSGRDIPVASDRPAAHLRISEGAVRGLLRSAGDGIVGVVVGRCRLDGDITTPGTPVTVEVDASVLWGTRMVDAAERVREAMLAALALHTDLVVAAIDVTVHDVHGQPIRRTETS